MIKRILAAALGVLLLSSCTSLPIASTEELLEAPRLSTRQEEMYQALELAMNTSSIQYKYPKSGNYRSPFVFYDLDGDGAQEAVVFYAHNDAPDNARATIFRQDAAGGWNIAYDIPGGGDQIDFIRFSSLLDNDSECLVIGWQQTWEGKKTLGVYSAVNGAFREETVQPYLQYVVGVYDSTGIERMVIAQEADGGYFDLLLLGRGVGGRLQELDRTSLATSTREILQMLVGGLWEGAGIYIDQLWYGNQVYTEVFSIAGNRLVPIAAESGGEDISSTMRDYRSDGEQILALDIDRDGIIEIPVLFDLPAVEEEAELAPLMLTQLLQIGEEGYESRFAVINPGDGYALFFPEKWVDTVTVIRQPEYREWQFYAVDEEGALAGELLRIRAHDTRDYMDKFLTDYDRLRQDGLMEYYVYIPRTPDEMLAVTKQEIEALFLLL